MIAKKYIWGFSLGMCISSLKCFTPCYNTIHIPKCFTLPCDSVSFSSKNNFWEQPFDEIIEKLGESISDPNNLIGCGGDAVVYAVKDTNYCIRLPYDEDYENPAGFVDYGRVLSFDLTEQDKVNHVVAKMDNGVTIMKKINGKPILSVDMTDKDILKNLKKVAKMPLSAYNKLLNQVCEAYKLGMVFDPYGPNVMMDTEKFVAIDFQKMSHRYPSEFFPTLGVYDSLISVQGIYKDLEKSVARKTLLATLKEFEPQKKPCFEVEDLKVPKFLSFMCKNGVINNEQLEKMWDAYFTMERYKKLELAGFNANPELAKSVLVMKKLVKENFKEI